MGVGALALVLATLGLIASSFAGRYAVARLLGVREIGIFGPRRSPSGVSASPLRRLAERNGQSRTLEVTPNAQGLIGVKPVMHRKPLGLGRSLARAAIEPLRVVQATAAGILRIVTGSEPPSLSGPVAMSREVGQARERGIAEALFMIAALAAYVWPGFIILEVLLAAATWRDRRHQPRELAGRP